MNSNKIQANSIALAISEFRTEPNGDNIKGVSLIDKCETKYNGQRSNKEQEEQETIPFSSRCKPELYWQYKDKVVKKKSYKEKQKITGELSSNCIRLCYTFNNDILEKIPAHEMHMIVGTTRILDFQNGGKYEIYGQITKEAYYHMKDIADCRGTNVYTLFRRAYWETLKPFLTEFDKNSPDVLSIDIEASRFDASVQQTNDIIKISWERTEMNYQK